MKYNNYLIVFSINEKRFKNIMGKEIFYTSAIEINKKVSPTWLIITLKKKLINLKTEKMYHNNKTNKK